MLCTEPGACCACSPSSWLENFMNYIPSSLLLYSVLLIINDWHGKNILMVGKFLQETLEKIQYPFNSHMLHTLHTTIGREFIKCGVPNTENTCLGPGFNGT
jgi:hypothetical protein